MNNLIDLLTSYVALAFLGAVIALVGVPAFIKFWNILINPPYKGNGR